jgi:RimJ/RimL family protein N-acetyltransferase
MMNDRLRQLTASELLTIDGEVAMQQSWLHDDYKCTFILLARNRLGASWNIDDELRAMIGDINIFINKDERIGEISVMIAEENCRQQGYGAEAVQLLMRYAIDRLAISRFEARIDVDNVASVRLFGDKLGFVSTTLKPNVFNEITMEYIVDGREQQLTLPFEIGDYVDL